MVLQGGPCGRVGRRRTIVGRRAPHMVRGPSSFPPLPFPCRFSLSLSPGAVPALACRAAGPTSYRRSMRYDLIIFDNDGVLVDSEPISNTILAAYLTELGHPTTFEESVRDYMGAALHRVHDLVLER